ncbi:MAG: DUF6067 family protein, partial [Victivallaceae bacterium]|nr:DUF6067 family protein [Victivallaceae bacterium]
MKKNSILGFLFLLTVVYAAEKQDPVKVREREYFKSPDYWELTLGDQKDYLESQLEKYCAEEKLDAAKLEYVCGIAGSLQKVFKNKYWFKGVISGKVKLSMAANEREAVQIAVLPLREKDLKAVKIAVSELRNANGDMLPASGVSIYNVCYIKTAADPAYPVPQVREWPDPLVPMRPVDIPCEECRAFWLEIRTPKDAKPGLYNGWITVSGGNIRTQKLKLSVKIWPFALPERQIVETCTWLPRAKAGKDKENRLRKYRKYCEFFLDYKINPLGLGNYFYNKNDYSVVLKNLEWAVKKGLTRFQIPRLKGRELKDFCNALRKENLFDKAMIYGYKDEPHPRDYETFKKDSAEIRKTEPELKIFMEETPHPGLYGAVDIWWAS